VSDAREPDAQDQRPGRPATGRKALGKGLGALIGESRAALGHSTAAPTLGEGRLRELPLADISVNRRQPRRTFSDDELRELAASGRGKLLTFSVEVRSGPVAIGVTYELARMETIHPQPYDIPMDYVVTERGVYQRGDEGLVFLDMPRSEPLVSVYSSPACLAHEIAPGYFGEDERGGK